jgi:photosystem II stability/assembly factor-like uncharacterized protein
VKQNSGSFAWLHAVFFVDVQRGWAVGSKGALLQTADGGARWTLRPKPSEDALEDVFFTDEQTGWIVCERSIYMPMRKEEARTYLLKTTDGGDSWRRVDVLSGADVDIVLARVRFADSEHGWVFGEMGALFATADGGASWTRQRVPTRHLLLGASFLDAQQGWLVGAGATVLQTSDGGATWRAGNLVGLTTPYAAKPLKDATADATRLASGTSATTRARMVGARAAAQTDVQADAQASSQANVQADAPSLRLNAVSFADAQHGWAVGAHGAVLATTDGGRTWRAQTSGTQSDLFDVKFFDAREGWAVGGDGTAIHTTDGGATWRAAATGTPHQLERIFFSDARRGWAVGFGGTIISFKG